MFLFIRLRNIYDVAVWKLNRQKFLTMRVQLSRPPPCRKLWWARGNAIPEVDSLTGMSRKELFSTCGKLVGHYPVAGWLRVACSYIKRHAGGSAWDDKIGNRPLAWIRGDEACSKLGSCARSVVCTSRPAWTCLV